MAFQPGVRRLDCAHMFKDSSGGKRLPKRRRPQPPIAAN
jgi:hypothetical protein